SFRPLVYIRFLYRIPRGEADRNLRPSVQRRESMKTILHIGVMALVSVNFTCVARDAVGQDKPVSASGSDAAIAPAATATPVATPGARATANLYLYRHRRYEGA